MASGKLHDIVSVEAETRTPDGHGGFTHTWAEVGQLWAAVAPVRSAESTREGTLRNTTVYKVEVLAEAAAEIAITASHRLVWNGLTLNIREAPVQTSRSPMLPIIAEAGVAQ